MAKKAVVYAHLISGTFFMAIRRNLEKAEESGMEELAIMNPFPKIGVRVPVSVSAGKLGLGLDWN